MGKIKGSEELDIEMNKREVREGRDDGAFRYGKVL